jgi:hypothetical protein
MTNATQTMLGGEKIDLASEIIFYKMGSGVCVCVCIYIYYNQNL